MGHTHMDMGFEKHSNFLCYVVNLMTMMISQESGKSGLQGSVPESVEVS